MKLSVTRGKAKRLQSNQYHQICRVKIPRIEALDLLAFSLVSGRITRHKSIPNLADTDDHSILQSPSAPNLDLNKIRSILKNPIGKPRSIINRRQSMPARVVFSESVTEYEIPRNETSQGHQEIVDLLDSIEQPSQQIENGSISEILSGSQPNVETTVALNQNEGSFDAVTPPTASNIGSNIESNDEIMSEVQNMAGSTVDEPSSAAQNMVNSPTTPNDSHSNNEQIANGSTQTVQSGSIPKDESMVTPNQNEGSFDAFTPPAASNIGSNESNDLIISGCPNEGSSVAIAAKNNSTNDLNVSTQSKKSTVPDLIPIKTNVGVKHLRVVKIIRPKKPVPALMPIASVVNQSKLNVIAASFVNKKTPSQVIPIDKTQPKKSSPVASSSCNIPSDSTNIGDVVEN